MSFRLTYATMFNPPEELHERFERALATVRGRLGATHAMFIDGKDIPAAATEERRSPIDNQISIGRFPNASAKEVDAALAAAHRAFPAWRDAGAATRVALMRKVARILEERVYEIAAALVLEVGKNRLEALGEAQECVDFFDVYAEDFESHKGYEFGLPNDPSNVFVSRNRSVMRPYGVWAVIAPFNFPIALAAGPDRRGARDRQHGRPQVRLRHRPGRAASRRLHPRRRPAAGRIQLRQRPGRRHRRTDDPRCTHLRGDLHGLRRRRAHDHGGHGERPVRAALHRRDGRQEPDHRHGERGPRPRGRRHRALGLRHGKKKCSALSRSTCTRKWLTR